MFETTPNARPGRPIGVCGNDTRQRVIDVAAQMFAARGYGITTNKTLAAAAGVTQGVIHYHFGSKRAVYEAVCNQSYGLIIDRFQAAAPKPTALNLLVVAILQASVEILRTQPWLATLTSTAPLEARRHPELAPVVHAQEEALFAFLRDRVLESPSTGFAAPSSTDTADTLEVMYALLTGFAARAATYDPDSYLRRVHRFAAILGVNPRSP